MKTTTLGRVHENVVDVVIDFCGRPPTKMDHHKIILQTFSAPPGKNRRDVQPTLPGNDEYRAFHD